MKLRACHDFAIEWSALTIEQRGTPQIAGLAAILYWITMSMWGQPADDAVSKQIVACGDRGPDVGYYNCFRHGQYLLTNISTTDERPRIISGSEPSIQTLLKFFKVEDVNKLLNSIPHKEPAQNSEPGAAQFAFQPDLEYISEITRPTKDLKGIRFNTDPSLLPEVNTILQWECHHLLEGLFQMLCQSFWATVPRRNADLMPWLVDDMTRHQNGVDEWRLSPETIRRMFTNSHVAGSTGHLRYVMGHCFPLTGIFKLPKQPYQQIWTEIVQRTTRLQLIPIYRALSAKLQTLNALPKVESGKWWKTTVPGGVALLVQDAGDEGAWKRAGYLGLEEVLETERGNAGRT